LLFRAGVEGYYKSVVFANRGVVAKVLKEVATVMSP